MCSAMTAVVFLFELLMSQVIRTAAVPRRLRITNGCSKAPMWIAHMAREGPAQDPQNVRIQPLQSYSFLTPDGLTAARWWPKMACDEQGNDCGIGGSGGPDESCVVRSKDGQQDFSKCAPPMDTKFEATLGTMGMPCDATNQGGCDYVDMSLVDGFTLPFKLTTMGGKCSPSQVIDCSDLSLDKCPQAESLSTVGITNLTAVNPRTGQVAGCYSPCMKLIDNKWNKPRSRDDLAVQPFCCPTPPLTPEACKAGPISDTHFVQTIHQFCPGVYAFAYDDAMGTVKCDSSTQYDVTFFCPSVPLVQPTTLPPTLPPTSSPVSTTTSEAAAAPTTRPHSDSSSHGSGSTGPGPCGVLHDDSCCSRAGEQCGGEHWYGATCCREGASCFHVHAAYSECRQRSNQQDPDVNVVVTEGGGGRDGDGSDIVIRVTRGTRFLWALALGGCAFVLALVSVIAACALACRSNRHVRHGRADTHHDEATSALTDPRLLSLALSADSAEVLTPGRSRVPSAGSVEAADVYDAPLPRNPNRIEHTSQTLDDELEAGEREHQ